LGADAPAAWASPGGTKVECADREWGVNVTCANTSIRTGNLPLVSVGCTQEALWLAIHNKKSNKKSLKWKDLWHSPSSLIIASALLRVSCGKDRTMNEWHCYSNGNEKVTSKSQWSKYGGAAYGGDIWWWHTVVTYGGATANMQAAWLSVTNRMSAEWKQQKWHCAAVALSS